MQIWKLPPRLACRACGHTNMIYLSHDPCAAYTKQKRFPIWLFDDISQYNSHTILILLAESDMNFNVLMQTHVRM